MLTVIGIAIGLLGLGFIYRFNAQKKFDLYHKRTQELHDRLLTLEDRIYHPKNYNEAFFRPTGKKKED